MSDDRLIAQDSCEHPEIRYTTDDYTLTAVYRCAVCGKGVNIPLESKRCKECIWRNTRNSRNSHTIGNGFYI